MGTRPVQWILMTGVSRGIGRTLAEHFQKNGFFVCGMVRNAQVANVQSRLDAVLPWDLSLSWEKNDHSALSRHLEQHKVVGFVHAAGVLGPVAALPDPQHKEEWQQWWTQYEGALRVNHLAGLEIVAAVKNKLQPCVTEVGERPPFLLHLSSGAAVKPYAGWDAYCASKAAMLMAFRCLAAEIDATRLSVLSVAPGTVMTDMMQQVLACNPDDFPAVSKFKTLEKTGGLVSPEVPAQQICRWLLQSSNDELKKWHGELYDVRSNS